MRSNSSVPLLQHSSQGGGGGRSFKKQESKKPDYLQSLIKYIPVTVLRHLTDKYQQERELPEGQNMKTAVLVAEMKNFYDRKSQKFSTQRTEQHINEKLAEASNQFLELTSKIIHKYGGDIVQFLGNSLIAIWPNDNQSINNFSSSKLSDLLLQNTTFNSITTDDEVIIGRRAVQCALDIKNERLKMPILGEIQLGLGFGKCALLHVGGVLKRVEYFLVGESLSQALRSLQLSSISQPVIISQALASLVAEHFTLENVKLGYTGIGVDKEEFDAIMDQEIHGDQAVTGMQGSGVLSKVNTLVLRSKINVERLKEIQVDLKAYIPAAFRPYIRLKRDTAGNEHRRITIMVINIELSYELEDLCSLVLVQKIITIIQQQVYRMEGSLSKIIAYDNGFTIVASWGLSPYSHDDDSARAIFAAQNIQKKMNILGKSVGSVNFQLPIHIGISTGSVFMGIIGSESGRKEVVMIGEAMERAFLLMQASTKVYGKIYVDFQSKLEASLFIEFKYLEHVEFANKFTNQPIFEPVDQNISTVKQIKKKSDIYSLLKLHANPFLLDHANAYQQSYCQIYGMATDQNVLDQIVADIADYAAKPESSTWNLAIKGDAGAGKTLFARALLTQLITHEKKILHQRNEIQARQAQERYAPEIQFNYTVTSCNAEIAKRFMGIWIPFLRELLSIYSVQKGTKADFMLNKMIRGSLVDNKVQIIEELFGIRGLHKQESEQLIILEDPNQFSSVQSYPKDVEDDVLSFLHTFIREAVFDLKDELLFILTLDNVSLMDQASWKLLYLLPTQCEQLILILCLTSNSSRENQQASPNFKISQNAFEFYRENIGPFEQDLFNICELNPLTIFDLREILIDIARQYQSEIKNEIHLVTQIIDRKNPLKTFTTQTEVQRDLMNHFQVNDHFMEVEKELIEAVVTKCKGNPQLCISLMYQLLTTGFLEIRERILLSSLNLRHAMKTKCWNDIQLPPLALKLNCQLIESIYQQNASHKKLSTDKFVNAFNILKVASVIGEVFSMQQILSVSESLTDEAKHRSDTLLILNELEVRGLIELVYEDGLGDSFYRFENIFLRESLFQLQMYEGQRRITHSRMLTYLKDNYLHNWQTDWSYEKESIMFLQHLLLEQGVDSLRDLSSQARKIYVIKRVNCSLVQNAEVIRQGLAEYLKTKPQKKFKQWYLVLSQSALTWYKSSEDAKKKNQKGAIKLEQIIRISQAPSSMFPQPQIDPNIKVRGVPIQTVPQFFVFQIQCNEYYNNYKLKQKPKTVTIKVENIKEGEDWISYIEYMKTKASIDAFAQNYGAFSIPKVADANIANSMKQVQHFESFAHMIQREISQNKQQEPMLKILQSSPSISPKPTIKPKKTVLLQQHELSHEIPEQVTFLKNTLQSLYSVLSIKTISHLEVNASKLRPADISTPQHKEEYKYIFPTVENDSSLIEGGSGFTEQKRDWVSKLTQIRPLAELRRELGDPTGVQLLDDSLTISREGPIEDQGQKSDDDESIDAGATTGTRKLRAMATSGYEDPRRQSFYHGETSSIENTVGGGRRSSPENLMMNSMRQKSRISMRAVDSSQLPMDKSMKLMEEFSHIENVSPTIAGCGVQQDPEESMISFSENRKMSYIEEKGGIAICRVQIPLSRYQFKEGEISQVFQSAKEEPPASQLLKRRRQSTLTVPSSDTLRRSSISNLQLNAMHIHQRADMHHALTRVLDKARVVGTCSQHWLQQALSNATLMQHQCPSLLELSHMMRSSAAVLRKAKSMKGSNKVRFNAIDRQQLMRDESTVSIGESMALEEIKRYAAQGKSGRDTVKVMGDKKQKSTSNPETAPPRIKKIYKESPPISREQSKIMIDVKEVVAQDQEKPSEKEESSNECNVDDSVIVDLQLLEDAQERRQIQESVPVNVSRKQEAKSSLIEMYLKEDTQCMVINDPRIKNIVLNKGYKVRVENSFVDLDIVQVKIPYQGIEMTVIIPGASLDQIKPLNARLLIQTNTPSSESQEDSKLLRQPSDKCLPKSIPNFNSFTTKSPDESHLRRSRPNPYHKFLQPVAHDSTIRSFHDDEDTDQDQQQQPTLSSQSSYFDQQYSQGDGEYPPASEKGEEQSSMTDSGFIKESQLQSKKTTPRNDNLEFTLSKPYPSPKPLKREEKDSNEETSGKVLSRTQTVNKMMKMQMRRAIKMAEEERVGDRMIQSASTNLLQGAKLKIQERRSNKQSFLNQVQH